jgi:hypothetical protein
MMVLMALTTTFMTSPVLEVICPGKMLRGETEAATCEQVGVSHLGLNPAGD